MQKNIRRWLALCVVALLTACSTRAPSPEAGPPVSGEVSVSVPSAPVADSAARGLVGKFVSVGWGDMPAGPMMICVESGPLFCVTARV